MRLVATVQHRRGHGMVTDARVSLDWLGPADSLRWCAKRAGGSNSQRLLDRGLTVAPRRSQAKRSPACRLSLASGGSERQHSPLGAGGREFESRHPDHESQARHAWPARHRAISSSGVPVSEARQTARVGRDLGVLAPSPARADLHIAAWGGRGGLGTGSCEDGVVPCQCLGMPLPASSQISRPAASSARSRAVLH